MVRCLGPLASAVMNGRLMSVVRVLDSSTFAFSAASRTRCVAILSFLRSMPVWRWNSFSMYSTNTLSMSVPPSCVSPLVLTTLKPPSFHISMMVTSRVPPPKSKTRIFSSLPAFSRP